MHYHTRINLLGQPADDAQARAKMLVHPPQVQVLIQAAATWLGYALLRRNDARHLLHQICVLTAVSIHVMQMILSRVRLLR
jgi:hypothetical protein